MLGDCGFPEDARVNSTLGIIRILYHNKKRLKIKELAKLSKSNVDLLLPQVNAARILGLIKISDTDVVLTELGKSFHFNDTKAREEIKEKLKKYEPFKTLSKRSEEGITIDEIVVRLLKKGVCWHTEKSENREKVHRMLMQWAVYFGIATYSGIDKRWRSTSNS